MILFLIILIHIRRNDIIHIDNHNSSNIFIYSVKNAIQYSFTVVLLFTSGVVSGLKENKNSQQQKSHFFNNNFYLDIHFGIEKNHLN